MWLSGKLCACKKTSSGITSVVVSVIVDTLDGKYTVENSKEWTCPKCEETGYGFGYRYKIQIHVKDHSGYASLCLFDTHAAKILGVSVYDLYKSLPADAEEDTFPEEINSLVGKLYVFMVNISRYNIKNKYYVYTIAKFSNEAELLGQFPAEMELLEESNGNGAASDDSSPSKTVDSPASVVSPGASGSKTDASSPSKTVISPGVKRRTVEGMEIEKLDGSPVKKRS